MFSHNRLKFPLLLIILAIFSSLASAQRAVLTVTTLADTLDEVCDANCSLRDAIFAANPFDTVIFAREVRGGTIELTGPVIINKHLTIDGPNKRRITLKGNNTFRILELHGVLNIDGLIIRDGNAVDKEGGGVFSNGTVVLSNCAILNNRALRGGGIYMLGGALTLGDSTVAGNTALADNSAGGLDLFQTRTRIHNSTISGNQLLSKVDGAGGIRITNAPFFFIIGSTISSNSTLARSSISAGGLVSLNGGSASIWNSIVAKNEGAGVDYYGQAVARNSFIGIAHPGSGYTNGVDGNIIGTAAAPADPQLGALLDNGGGIPTHALRPRSAAIDAGNNELSEDNHGDPENADQRGFVRKVNATVDIGAFEANSWAMPVVSTIKGIVRSTDGRGIFKARVNVRDTGGAERSVMTLPFGYYHIDGLAADRFYNVECQDKRYGFLPQSLLVEEAVEYVDCRAEPFFHFSKSPLKY